MAGKHGAAAVAVSWRVRHAAWTDLADRLHPRRQMMLRLLCAGPGAMAMGLGIGLAATGDHTLVVAILSWAGTILVGLTLGGIVIQTNRLLSPATPAMIAALRRLIAPELWQEVTAAAAHHRRFAPALPVTPVLIYAWLDQAIDAGRGRTLPQIAVAAQARAFG